MSSSNQTRRRRNLSKMLWIGFSWMMIGVAQEVFVFLITKQYHTEGSNYEFYSNIIILMPALFVSGLIGGYIITYLLENWLRSIPFNRVLLIIFLLYTVVFFVAALIGTLVNMNLLQNEGILGYDASFPIFEYIRHYFFWLLITLGTMITLQVSDKYGPGGFQNLLLGKYFRPQIEDRIFLFLDLRSSTMIAEKLGEKKYFHFLRSCFRDLTNPILNHKGEIYQYVGDEIVVTWPTPLGLKKSNCIACFFDAHKIMEDKAEYYKNRFGFSPTFKAGIHLGSVTAGEIGIIKKDIVYSGDVLNTTARIQGECNNNKVDILISGDLKKRLNLTSNYQTIKMSEVTLRGKSETKELFTIKPIHP